MKDFRGTELKVGDRIAYVTRSSSYMEVKETFIVDFNETESWNGETIETIIARNPAYISKEEQEIKFYENRAEALKEDPNHWYYSKRTKPYYTYHPKTVILRCPKYIIKVGNE